MLLIIYKFICFPGQSNSKKVIFLSRALFSSLDSSLLLVKKAVSNTFCIELDLREGNYHTIFRAEIYKYYKECDWSKKWAEGLQKF